MTAPAVPRKPAPLSPWMTTEEVAEYLRVSTRMARKLGYDKILTRYRPRGMKQHVLYLRKEVYELVEKATTPVAEGITPSTPTGVALPTDTVERPRVTHG